VVWERRGTGGEGEGRGEMWRRGEGRREGREKSERR
jgi:hypothetical protein